MGRPNLRHPADRTIFAYTENLAKFDKQYAALILAKLITL
jgi:hypothetical protein